MTTNEIKLDSDTRLSLLTQPQEEKISTRVRHTAISLRYDYKGESKENKTVLGYFNKKKVEKIVDSISVVSLVKGVVKTFVSAFQLITKKIKDFGESFAKFTNTYGFGFDVLETTTALYSLYDDGVHSVKAIKNGDNEESRDRSIAFTTSAGIVTANSLGAASYAEGLKTSSSSAVAQSATLALAASGIAVAVWGIYAAVQAVAIKRIVQAVCRLKKAFSMGGTQEDKYRHAIDDIKKQIEITDLENKNLQEKVQHLTQKDQDEQLKDLRLKLIEKKHNRLKKRVGDEMAQKVIENIGSLSEGLHSQDEGLRKKTLAEAKGFIKNYKSALNKELKIKTLRFVGAFVGFVAAIVAISNPIGGGILSGVATGFLIYSWYKGRYKKPEDFKEFSIFGYKPFDFAKSEDTLDFLEDDKNGSADFVEAKAKKIDELAQLKIEVQREESTESVLKLNEHLISALSQEPADPAFLREISQESAHSESSSAYLSVSSSLQASRSNSIVSPIDEEALDDHKEVSKLEHQDQLLKTAEDERYKKILAFQREQVLLQNQFIQNIQNELIATV